MTSLQVAKEMLEKEGQKRKVREEDKDLLEHRFVSVTCPAFDFEGIHPKQGFHRSPEGMVGCHYTLTIQPFPLQESTM